jgi:predicted PurR-regulated permease PerM
MARGEGATLGCMKGPPPVPNRIAIAAWVATAFLLVLVLYVHLLPALFGGLLVFELVHLAAPALQRHLSDHRAKVVVVALLAALIVGVLGAAAFALALFLQSDPDRPAVLLTQFADMLLRAKATLPGWVADLLPGTPEEIADWARDHASGLELAGREIGRAFVYALIGMIVGAMVALLHEVRTLAIGPFGREMAARAASLSSAFRRVVFAQVRISLVNTAFTGIYLAAVLPLFGVNVPFKKTLIVLTFVCGLIPVLGNLISNTFIVIASLTVSPETALASLAFLVIIHKLEYFLNARIIGQQIRARAWELLVALLVMEATFGLPGVAAAPIYYCFLKDELTSRGLI